MVKCLFLIITLSNDIHEQVGYFNSCESASNYVVTRQLDVVMMTSLPLTEYTIRLDDIEQ